MFGPLFFENTGVVDDKSASIVGVDFVSRHRYPASDGRKRMHQKRAVAMKRQDVDLSAVLLRKKTLAECSSAKFFPNCEAVDFAQDWVVFDELIKNCKAKYRLVPEIKLRFLPSEPCLATIDLDGA